jgi:hypothetical protein
MPIKPENRARYPAHWKEIRQHILERAANCCELCRVPNGVTVLRGMGKDKGAYQTPDGVTHSELNGGLICLRPFDFIGYSVKIVLTIAHLDHVPEHCDDDNLKALCQRCHLAYDAEHHRANAQATRHARKAIGDLFAKETNNG